jgi:hypothetical protein
VAGPLTPEDAERLRRSLATLPPGAPGLDRETAMVVLAELERLQDGLRQMIQQCKALLAGDP